MAVTLSASLLPQPVLWPGSSCVNGPRSWLSRDWDTQMLFFVHHGYRVIGIDRRGHGRSSQVSDGHDMDHYDRRGQGPLRWYQGVL
jgi:pimeloyl-ACP methyl ester carboxylesterase